MRSAKTGGRVVVVEDHFEAGGLGEAVAAALAGEAPIRHLCVRELPRSGPASELLDKYGINAEHIVAAVKALCGWAKIPRRVFRRDCRRAAPRLTS